MEIKHSSTNRTHVRCAHVRPPISCRSHFRHRPTTSIQYPTALSTLLRFKVHVRPSPFINPIRQGDCMSSSNRKLRKAAPQPQPRSRLPSIHWLFRSNIPRRRTSYISTEVHKRNFFGMGEILGVITKVGCFFTLSSELFTKKHFY
jgi:hypothetical protein